MTTPLSKMVALLIPSPLTPKRGLGSAGSLSEAKKGVAKVCGDRLSSVGDYSRQRTPRCVFRGRLESPKDFQGLKGMDVSKIIKKGLELTYCYGNKKLYFCGFLVLFNKYTKFYLIVTNDVWIT